MNAATNTGASKKVPTKGDLESLVIVNVLASLGFGVIIFFSGEYKVAAFWVAAALVVGVAYMVSLVPDRLKLWRYALIVVGFFAPGAIGPLLQSDQDYSAAGLVFLMALFWLPLIRSARRSDTA
ncbi:hypothetical protein DGWBC_0222 [Dehalogenimonas sp. WBC-2]|nr:hypothetical protein DGWBC_0222 [Dehalogenimonas sp. WBC-2]